MQESLSLRVGKRIRSFRKARGLSVSQVSDLIGKSEATYYKYESGLISPDIDTIQRISQALQIEPTFLFDIPHIGKSSVKNIAYLDLGKLYSYYYDGRIQSIVKSLLLFYKKDEEKTESTAFFYMNLHDFGEPEKSRYIYSGQLRSHEMVSYFIMENVTMPIETLLIQLVHPMQTSQTTWGIFMGLSDQPTAPMTTKMLFSRSPLSAKELESFPLAFTKEELLGIRKRNAILLSIR